MAVALACIGLSALGAAAAEARTDNRSKPVVYLHGLDAAGTAGVDCNMWNSMISTMNGWGNDYLRAECEDGTLELDRRRLRVLRGGAGDVPRSEDLSLLEQSAWTNPWLAELFCDWLRGGPAPPNHVGDNIQCCALLFAAVESAHTGRPVDVQAFLQRHREAGQYSGSASARG